jgi:hypothetical protein
VDERLERARQVDRGHGPHDASAHDDHDDPAVMFDAKLTIDL